MGIKDKVRRASKIFTSDSKENLTETTAPEAAASESGEVPSEGAVAEPETTPQTDVVTDAVDATAAETVEDAADAPTETAAEVPADIAAAEVPAETTEGAEATEATEGTTAKGEDAIKEVKKSAGAKEKKSDFFKKLLLKFKKTPSTTA